MADDLKQNLERMQRLRARALKTCEDLRRELEMRVLRIGDSLAALQDSRVDAAGLVAVDINIAKTRRQRNIAQAAAVRAEQVWQDFLVHCGGRQPEHGIAVDYVLRETADLADGQRAMHAAGMLQELHARAAREGLAREQWRPPTRRRKPDGDAGDR